MQKCGIHHRPRKCLAFNQQCRQCSKIGHFSIGCKVKLNNKDFTRDNKNNVDQNKYVRAICNNGSDNNKQLFCIKTLSVCY